MGNKKKYIELITNSKLKKEAFTHRSYLNETKENIPSNERLEFLGDAVLELVVSEHLFHTYANYPEGKLTLLRSSVVRTKTLAKAAKQCELSAHLLLSRGEEENGGRDNPSILANTYEAFLGALYLDRGMEQAKAFIHDTVLPMVPNIIEKKLYLDAKSHLQEIIQEKKRITPMYKVIYETGPDHSKIFTVGVYINQTKIGEGTGKSKQEAEEKAAREALEQYKNI